MNSNTVRLSECIFRGLLQDLARQGGPVPDDDFKFVTRVDTIEALRSNLSDWTRVALDRRFIADLGLLGKHLDGELAAGRSICYDDLDWSSLMEVAPDNMKVADFIHDVLLYCKLAVVDETKTIRYVRQFYHILGKLELTHEKDTEEKAFVDLRDRNRDLGLFWTRGRRTDCASRLVAARGLIRSLFRSYGLSNAIPTHGPGAVSGGERGIEKMSFSYLGSPRFPFDEWFFLSPSHLCDEGLVGSIPVERDVCSLQSRVVAVPKDLRGPRIICAEPKEAQWLQQGIWSVLGDLIEDHPVLSSCIDFYDQTKNGALALLASRNGEYVTIDLSEASDRIAIDLVYLLFHMNGRGDRFYRDFLACRSRRARFPDGCMMKLRMATTMGSALCFPLQSVVFLSLIYQAMVDRRPSTRLSALTGRVRVFGDDLIVHRDDANHVIQTLTSVGLKVNVRKTCVGDSFKESCGVDAFKGTNVTPVRLKSPVGKRITANQLEALCATQRRLWLAGYQISAQALASFIKELEPRVPGVPSWYPDRVSISVICSNHYFDAPTRYCKKVQCMLIRGLVSVTPVTKIKNTSWGSLLLAMSKAGRRPAFVNKSRRAFGYKAAWLRVS